MAKPLCRKRERIYITSIHNQFKLSRSWSKLPVHIGPTNKLTFFFKHKTHTKRRKDQGEVSERGKLKLSKEKKPLSLLCGTIKQETSLTETDSITGCWDHALKSLNL